MPSARKHLIIMKSDVSPGWASCPCILFCFFFFLKKTFFYYLLSVSHCSKYFKSTDSFNLWNRCCFSFYWGLVALQCCVCFFFLLYSAVNQLYVYIYYLPLGPPSHPHPSSHLSRASESAELSSVCDTAASHWLFVLHVVVYMCHSQRTVFSYSFSMSVPLFLPCK